MSTDILNPGTITFWPSGMQVDKFGSPVTLSPKEYMLLYKRTYGYNFKKFWMKSKINTIRFRSIIRKAKQNNNE